MRLWSTDIETDGLNPTKIHCIVCKLLGTDNYYEFSAESNLQTDDFLEFCMDEDGFVFHNGVDFDLPVLSRLVPGFSFEVMPELGKLHSTFCGKKVELIDTMVDSKWLYPDRPMPEGCPEKIFNPLTGLYNNVGPHSLNAWAFRVDGTKPQIHDWLNLPIKEYLHRCKEDVIVTERVCYALTNEMKDYHRTRQRPHNRRLTGIEI